MIHRYSSRRNPLKDFLATQLQGARRYDRIAGFFSSSLLEVADKALERMAPEAGEIGALPVFIAAIISDPRNFRYPLRCRYF